jgi:hypothetical protein
MHDFESAQRFCQGSILLALQQACLCFRPVLFNLGHPFRTLQVREGFIVVPVEGIAVDGIGLLVRFGLLVEIGITLFQPDPFDFLLIETEEAAESSRMR